MVAHWRRRIGAPASGTAVVPEPIPQPYRSAGLRHGDVVAASAQHRTSFTALCGDYTKLLVRLDSLCPTPYATLLPNMAEISAREPGEPAPHLTLPLDRFWAKTTTDGQPGISVRDHCLNVGCVAEALREVLPAALQTLVPRELLVLAAGHDIGKLTVGFQRKCPVWLVANGLAEANATFDDQPASYDTGKSSGAQGREFHLRRVRLLRPAT
jgi:hypothetical protein